MTNVMYYGLQNLCANQTSLDKGSMYAFNARAQIAPGTSNIGTLFAISAETGKTLWRYDQRAGCTAITNQNLVALAVCNLLPIARAFNLVVTAKNARIEEIVAEQHWVRAQLQHSSIPTLEINTDSMDWSVIAAQAMAFLKVDSRA